MAITIRDRFWSKVRGMFAGLIGQSTTNPTAGVALQADEADGALHTKTVSGSVCAVTGAVTTSGTVTEASAADIKTAVQLIDDPVVAQDGTAFKAMTAGAELVDPASLPADGVAGKVRRLIANLKGMLFVTMGTALSGENGLTGSSGRIWCQVPGTGGTVLTDSGTLYASPCRVIGFIVTTSTAATAEGTFKDGGAGGTTKAGHFFNVIGSVFVPAFGLTVGTDLYFTKGTTWAGTIVAVVDPAV
jgi:hypothetical protein